MTDQADGEKIRGVVKWFNPTKGFGFIQLPGGGMDVFVHVNQLRKSGIHRALETGEPVTFRTERGTKGPFAVEVAMVEAEAQKQERLDGRICSFLTHQRCNSR